MNVDPDVVRYFPAALMTSESNGLIDRAEESFRSNGFGLWALEVRGNFLGYTGLAHVTFPSPVESRVEIGWRLAREGWGHGYASEAAALCFDDGFGRLGLDSIVAFTTTTNNRSEAVMKRIGMSRRRDLDFDHPRTPGWWGQRHIVYEMEADSWRRSREPNQ